MFTEFEPGELLRKIKITSDLVGKALFDEKGNIWRLVPKIRKKFWGLVSSEELESVRDGSNIANSITTLSVELTSEMISDWHLNTAKPAIGELTKSLAPIIGNCVSAGEKKFRKELLEALGTQGERMFSSLVSDKFEAIGGIYEQEKKQERIFQTDGPFPANTRFRWQLITPKHTYAAFCLETPPQCRNVFLV